MGYVFRRAMGMKPLEYRCSAAASKDGEDMAVPVGNALRGAPCPVVLINFLAVVNTCPFTARTA